MLGFLVSVNYMDKSIKKDMMILGLITITHLNIINVLFILILIIICLIIIVRLIIYNPKYNIRYY